MKTGSTITLFRPVGQAELDLIIQSDWKKFPPRLPEQPIFYPVLNQEYAAYIAQYWNAKYDGTGYVLKFEVDAKFIQPYQVHTVGAHRDQEYWIPAEELVHFNDAIVGKIELIQSFQRWTVYLLRCSDDTLYTGITLDLERRIKEHNTGKKGAKYTRGRTPVSLVKSFLRYSKGDALKLEHRIKNLSREDKLTFEDT